MAEPDLEGAINKFGETVLRIKAERNMLEAALRVSIGRMLSVQIDLKTGVSKAKASAALGSAIKSAEDLLAKLSA